MDHALARDRVAGVLKEALAELSSSESSVQPDGQMELYLNESARLGVMFDAGESVAEVEFEKHALDLTTCLAWLHWHPAVPSSAARTPHTSKVLKLVPDC